MRITDLLQVAEIERRSYDNPWGLNSFLAEFLNRRSYRLVARHGEPPRVTAFVIFGVAGPELHVNNLAVHPAYRQQGQASRLLEEAFRRGAEAGASEAYLEVRPSNRAALELYRKLGFTQVGVRRRYYADSGEDAWVLVRPIGQEAGR